MPVLLHCRTAPGGVYRNEFGARFLERGDIPARQFACLLEISGVRVQRPTTLLPRSVDHRIAVYFEHALCRAVRGAEQSVHDAAAQRSNATALSPADRAVRGTLDGTASRGEHRHGEAEAALHSGEKGRDWRRGKQSRKEHSRPQQPCAREDEENEARHEWSRSALAQSGARRLEKLPVRHSARTYRLAGPAGETLIDVLLHARTGPVFPS